MEEQIKAYQMLLGDLKEKAEELEISYLAGKEYIKSEKNKSLEEFNVKVVRNIDERIDEFKRQISQKQI